MKQLRESDASLKSRMLFIESHPQRDQASFIHNGEKCDSHLAAAMKSQIDRSISNQFSGRIVHRAAELHRR